MRVDPIVVVRDALATQQYQELPMSRTAPHGAVPPQSLADRPVVASAVGLVVVAAHGQTHQPAGPRSGHWICLLKISHGGSTGRGLYQFLELTPSPFSIWISRAFSS
jgi:hypothetical protein